MTITRAVATAPSRPPWVEDALLELGDVERGVLEAQATLTLVTLMLRTQHIDIPAEQLNQAFHDSEHVLEHVTSARRGLLMAWPAEGPHR